LQSVDDPGSLWPSDSNEKACTFVIASVGSFKHYVWLWVSVQLGDPLEQRQKEEELRGPAILELNYCINSFREAAQSKDAKYDHINAADKEKVLNAIPVCMSKLRKMLVTGLGTKMASFHCSDCARWSLSPTKQRSGSKINSNSKIRFQNLPILSSSLLTSRRKLSFLTGMHLL
jgi:hypothetical protein